MNPDRDYEELLDRLKRSRAYLDDLPALKEVEIWEIYHRETGKIVFKGEYREVKDILRKMYKENLTLVDVDMMLSIGQGFLDVVKGISAEQVFKINYKKELTQ